MGKVDANKVLGTFRNNYKARKGMVMNSYLEGGINQEACEVSDGPKCKHKSKSKGKRKEYNPRDGKGLNLDGHNFRKFGRWLRKTF